MRLLAVVMCFAFSTEQMSAQFDSLYLKNKTYHLQRGLHALSRTKKADVVMLGNSITFGANWSELLGRQNVVNRGIGGDNTYGFLSRLDDVIALQPKVCFVMGGINDIFADIPVDSIYVNYMKIIARLRASGIIPVIQSTLHVSPKWKHEIVFMDVDGTLSENECLKDEYTSDGVHLTAPAYGQWILLVEAVLKKNGL
jgi:lysophospholipase L1-like esterase